MTTSAAWFLVDASSVICQFFHVDLHHPPSSFVWVRACLLCVFCVRLPPSPCLCQQCSDPVCDRPEFAASSIGHLGSAACKTCLLLTPIVFLTGDSSMAGSIAVGGGMDCW
jgi:hypothetical protein